MPVLTHIEVRRLLSLMDQADELRDRITDYMAELDEERNAWTRHQYRKLVHGQQVRLARVCADIKKLMR